MSASLCWISVRGRSTRQARICSVKQGTAPCLMILPVTSCILCHFTNPVRPNALVCLFDLDCHWPPLRRFLITASTSQQPISRHQFVGKYVLHRGTRKFPQRTGPDRPLAHILASLTLFFDFGLCIFVFHPSGTLGLSSAFLMSSGRSIDVRG